MTCVTGASRSRSPMLPPRFQCRRRSRIKWADRPLVIRARSIIMPVRYREGDQDRQGKPDSHAYRRPKQAEDLKSVVKGRMVPVPVGLGGSRLITKEEA